MKSLSEKEKGQRDLPRNAALKIKKTQSSDESAKKLYDSTFRATGGDFRSIRRPAPSKKQPIEKGKGIGVYERRKAAWRFDHPDATPQTYDVAMNRIARESGI